MRHEIIDASQLELNDKVVSIKRVSKTVKGGRTMRFTALVVVGDGNGHVGVSLGKSYRDSGSNPQSKEDATKKLIKVELDANNSVPHDWTGVFGSASVLLKRAPKVPVSSPVARLVAYWRWLVLRTSVPNAWDPETNRTLFWQPSMV